MQRIIDANELIASYGGSEAFEKTKSSVSSAYTEMANRGVKVIRNRRAIRHAVVNAFRLHVYGQYLVPPAWRWLANKDKVAEQTQVY